MCATQNRAAHPCAPPKTGLHIHVRHPKPGCTSMRAPKTGPHIHVRVPIALFEGSEFQVRHPTSPKTVAWADGGAHGDRSTAGNADIRTMKRADQGEIYMAPVVGRGVRANLAYPPGGPRGIGNSRDAVMSGWSSPAAGRNFAQRPVSDAECGSIRPIPSRAHARDSQRTRILGRILVRPVRAPRLHETVHVCCPQLQPAVLASNPVRHPDADPLKLT
jgi:hypothetical protein